MEGNGRDGAFCDDDGDGDAVGSLLMMNIYMMLRWPLGYSGIVS